MDQRRVAPGDAGSRTASRVSSRRGPCRARGPGAGVPWPSGSPSCGDLGRQSPGGRGDDRDAAVGRSAILAGPAGRRPGHVGNGPPPPIEDRSEMRPRPIEIGTPRWRRVSSSRRPYGTTTAPARGDVGWSAFRGDRPALRIGPCHDHHPTEPRHPRADLRAAIYGVDKWCQPSCYHSGDTRTR